eukprot:s840_g4.t2
MLLETHILCDETWRTRLALAFGAIVLFEPESNFSALLTLQSFQQVGSKFSPMPQNTEPRVEPSAPKPEPTKTAKKRVSFAEPRDSTSSRGSRPSITDALRSVDAQLPSTPDGDEAWNVVQLLSERSRKANAERRDRRPSRETGQSGPGGQVIEMSDVTPRRSSILRRSTREGGSFSRRSLLDEVTLKRGLLCSAHLLISQSLPLKPPKLGSCTDIADCTMSDRSRSPRVERVHLEEAALEEQAKLVAAALSDDIRARLQQMVKEGLVKEGDFDLHGHLQGSSISGPYSQNITCLKMKVTPCLHGNARAQSWSSHRALDRAFQKSHLSGCQLTWLPHCLSWFTLGFALHHRCHRCHRARRGAQPASRVTSRASDADELLQAAQSLQDLQKQWMEIQIEDVPKAQELMQREADLREDLKAVLLSSSVEDCCYGDPAETWTPVDCEHPVVSAHSEVARALIETELGKLQWMLRCAAALGHEDLPLGKKFALGRNVYFPSIFLSWFSEAEVRSIEKLLTTLRKSERGNFADLLLKMAELRLRLFDVRESYDLLQRARPLIAERSRRRAVLQSLLDNCLMCECLKTTPSMFGVEISPDNAAAKTLRDFGRLLVEAKYNCSKILHLTGAESLIDFSNDDQQHIFAQNLAQHQSNEEGNLSLAYLIRLFILRMQEPLEDLFVMVGADCCKLLLELQVVTAVRDGYQLLSVEEAIQTATAATEESFAKVKCFSNVRLWPLEKLIIATDAQTWPYGHGIERFEPVMYLSDDSLALLDAKPEVEGLHLLDMCCGSGVQGISALARNAASVTFSDMNPRALRFVRFNLAINSLLRESCEFCLGDAYSALESWEGSQKFDGVLANPPFLPNPDGIASQAIALYGNGGAFGEDVLSSIVAGCSQWLVDGGWVLMVTYAPNVEQMPSRLQEYLASNCEVASVHVAAGNQKDAADFLPVASEVELHFYPKAVKEAGVESLSEALVFILLGETKETCTECTLDLRDSLFADQSYAMSIFSALNPDLQDRVLSYCDSNKIFMTNARSKSGFLVAACEKAKKGSLDARGFGTVDPYKEYLLTIAKPKREWVDLVPEQQWLEQTTDAQEVIFDVRADPEAGVSAIRLCLQLDRTVRSVKERLAAVGVQMPVQKMKLREASIGYMRDERTLAYYNLKSGSKVQLVAKQRGGRRQAIEKMG